MADRLLAVTKGMAHRFPEGNDPYKALARLLEEAGELAQAVNHFEGSGVKRQKYGEPDRKHMAKEVMQVMGAALSVALYYGVEQDVSDWVDWYYQRLVHEGHIVEEET